MTKLYSTLCSLLFVCAVFLLSNFYSFSAFSQCNPAANDVSFNPNDTGFGFGQGSHLIIYNFSKLSTNKVIVANSLYNGVHPKLFRLNEDGTIDATFTYGAYTPSSFVRDVKELSNGKLIVATALFPTSNTTLFLLESNGSLAANFLPTIFESSNITDVFVQPDNKIIAVGNIVINNVTKNIIRLNSDGSIDPTFTQGILTGQRQNRITDMVIQDDGKMIVVGIFDTYNGVIKNNILRLNSDGTIDTNFGGTGTDFNALYAKINSVVLQSDGKSIIGGAFESYNGIGRQGIARLNTDGSLDMSLDTEIGFMGQGNFISDVTDITLLNNNKILVSGRFTIYKTIPVKNMVILEPNGNLDTSFQPVESYHTATNTIEVANGKLLTNHFSSQSGLERLNIDGSFDETYNPNTGSNNTIDAFASLPDGKLFIGGEHIGRYNGKLINQIAKLNADGSIDNSFNFYRESMSSPIVGSNYITDIAAQPDGKVLVGGLFHYTTSEKRGIIRLQADGSIDASFSPTGDVLRYEFDAVNKIVLQDDGKIVLAYSIGFNPYMEYKVVRLNANGSVDNSFSQVSTDKIVSDIIIEPNGTILIGGYFTTVNGNAVGKVVRLLSDGTLASSFSSNLDIDVSKLAISTTHIYVAGKLSDSSDIQRAVIKKISLSGTIDPTFNIPSFQSYTTIGMNNSSIFNGRVIRDMYLEQDGSIVAVGAFRVVDGQYGDNIVKLNANGSVNMSFDVGVGANSFINQIVKNQDGSFLVAGEFTAYNGIGKNRIARIANIGSQISNTSLSQNQHGVCLNSTTTLEAVGQGTVYWYNSPTSSIPIHTGNSFTTPALIADSTYFYAQDSIVGCGSSNKLEVLVTTSQTLNAVSKTNYIAYLNNIGQIEVDAVLLDSISSAGCGNTITSYLFDDTGLATRTFSCADTNAVHDVVLRVTDSNGNTQTSPTSIHIKDTIAPTLSVRVLPLFFSASNLATTISARDFIISLNDNCTDSANINVVFHDTGLETRLFNCGLLRLDNYTLRITDQAGNQTTQSVIINPSSINHDFNVNIIGSTFRPDIASLITVVANNYSCVPKSGELKVTLPPNVIYRVSIPPTRAVGSDLFWNVTDLSFDRNFTVGITITPQNSWNMGDELCFTGHITPETNDLTRLNNQKAYCFPVVNSYDPNDKQVYPQGICDAKFTKRSDLPLTYTIRFQNIGNAPALNVRIADSLSSLLNRRSLRVVGSSHTMVVDTVAGNNVINFRFPNINLPDSTSSPELSQGYVIFELNEIAAHTDTSRISNKSYIYFDTNAPIITNSVKNTIVNVLPLCSPTNPNPPIAACTLPTNFRTEILTSIRVKLIWTSPTNTNAINYEILRDGQRLATIPASNLSFIDSTLIANTRYNYSIKAICGNSTATSTTVQVRTIPATPTLFSVEAACKGERGRMNVQSAGAVYRVYASQTATTPLFETNNASIQTPVLNDSTTFYISVVINGQESQRLKVVVPIKEVFDAIVEQGVLFESCATEFILSAKPVTGATYTWFRGNVQVGTERTLTTAFEALYKVRVVKNGCFDDSEFTTTRFVSAPTVTIQQGTSVSFCGSGILNAQDTSSNVVYTWILNGINVGNGTAINVSQTGTYTLKASQPSCSDSTNIVVKITPAPTNIALTASKTEICMGSETLLSATTSTGFTYTWFRNNVAISNSSATLSTSEIGKYKVEVTTQDGCKVTTNEVSITQKQATNATLSVRKEGNFDKTITISSSDSIVSVVWFVNGQEYTEFANKTTIEPFVTAKFKATLTYLSGCQFETREVDFTFVIIDDFPSGIEEESAKLFSIYPNPNNGSFKVEFFETTNQKTRLTLVDGLGRIIHSQEISTNEKMISISLPKISAGVYVVQVISEGKIYTKQLIIQ
jgi:uncharacterized delta-60 repeat protein